MRTVDIGQENCTSKTLSCLKMENCKSAPALATDLIDQTVSKSEALQSTTYQQTILSSMYLLISTKSIIAFVFQRLSQYAESQP